MKRFKIKEKKKEKEKKFFYVREDVWCMNLDMIF